MPNPDLRDTLRDTNPRIRETIDQMSDVASDLYDRASDWLEKENNRNYGFIALAATAGLVGFFIGRSMRSNSSDF